MAAERGNAEAQYCLGVASSTVGDVAEALKWLRKAANQGHKNAKEALRKLKFDL
jgi:TPR repeat protein